MFQRAFLSSLMVLVMGCAAETEYTMILRGGTIYDGSGRKPFVGDVALAGDTIASVGEIGRARGTTEIDVRGAIATPARVFQFGGRKKKPASVEPMKLSSASASFKCRGKSCHQTQYGIVTFENLAVQVPLPGDVSHSAFILQTFPSLAAGAAHVRTSRISSSNRRRSSRCHGSIDGRPCCSSRPPQPQSLCQQTNLS